MANDWNIKARSECCQETNRPFEDGESFYTILREGTPEEGVVREDICVEAWETRQEIPAENDSEKPEENPNVKSPLMFWKSVFKEEEPPPPEPVGKEDAESELRRLLEEGKEEDRKLAFLLGLLLERKRILKVREKIGRSGEKLTVYELPRTQETFLVPDLDMKLSELEFLQEELLQSSSRLFSVEKSAYEGETAGAETESVEPSEGKS